MDFTIPKKKRITLVADTEVEEMLKALAAMRRQNQSECFRQIVRREYNAAREEYERRNQRRA